MQFWLNGTEQNNSDAFRFLFVKHFEKCLLLSFHFLVMCYFLLFCNIISQWNIFVANRKLVIGLRGMQGKSFLYISSPNIPKPLRCAKKSHLSFNWMVLLIQCSFRQQNYNQAAVTCRFKRNYSILRFFIIFHHMLQGKRKTFYLAVCFAFQRWCDMIATCSNVTLLFGENWGIK